MPNQDTTTDSEADSSDRETAGGSHELTDDEKLKKFDEWACDQCGIRKSTCTKASESYCNECAGLTLEGVKA